MDSHEAKPFYRGRIDDHKLKVPNGAIVNRAYLDFIAAVPSVRPKPFKSGKATLEGNYEVLFNEVNSFA